MNSIERREARFQRRVTAREVKRHKKLSQYDNFERVADVDNLYEAFMKSMRGVGWKESIQRYYYNALRNILSLRRKLLAGENIHSGFVEFTLRERGKVRRIRSVHISERIVQKCLCEQVLVPILTNSLIYDNGASMKNKGVHFALKRFILHMTRYYRQHKSNEGYALLIYFSKFFDSIDHNILLDMINEKIKDERVRALTKELIIVFGDGVSLGLGSQVSQVSAVFFPNKLDHFIKEKLRIKYYGRYMDDLYLMHESKDYLKKCLDKIIEVCNSLKINVNMKKTRIVKLSQGVEFLKGRYFLLPSGKVLRKGTKESTKRMRKKLKKFKVLIDNGKMNYHDLRTSYQSWRGNYKRRFNAYYRIYYLDKLYYNLFISNHT